MRKIVLVFILTTIQIQSTFAQKERFSYDTKGFIQSGFYNLNAFPDDEDNIVVLHKQKTLDVPSKFFTYLMFSPVGGSQKEVKLIGDRHFIGYSFGNGMYTFVFKSDDALRNRKEIFQLIQVTKNGEIIKTSQSDLGDESVISTFTYNGNFYILSVIKSDELIQLRKISSSSEIKISSIGVDRAILKKLEDISAQIQHNDFEIQNRKLSGSKVFPIDDEKFRVFTSANIGDKNGDYVQSLILDFKSHQYSTSSLQVEHKTFRYFIAGDKLYLANVTSTQIVIQIYSLESSSKIASYSFNKGNTESVIFDGPFFKDGEAQDFKDRKQKIKAIFSKLSEGSEFINFLHLDGLNRVTIGARLIPTQTFTSVSPTGGVITRSPSVMLYDESDVEYYHFYVFLDRDLKLLESYPTAKSPSDIAQEFATKIKLENKKLVSDYRIVTTARKTFLITNSNKSKLIKCFEWDSLEPTR